MAEDNETLEIDENGDQNAPIDLQTYGNNGGNGSTSENNPPTPAPRTRLTAHNTTLAEEDRIRNLANELAMSSSRNNTDENAETSISGSDTRNTENTNSIETMNNENVSASVVSMMIANAINSLANKLNARAPVTKSERSDLNFPSWNPKEKLLHRGQWKDWQQKVHMDLKGLKLFECITSPIGKPEWDPEEREAQLARAHSYLASSLHHQIRSNAMRAPTPYEAYEALKLNFGENEMLDNEILWNRMRNLRFEMGRSPQKYVTAFRSIIHAFSQANLELSEPLQRTFFIAHIDAGSDYGNPLRTYKTNMASLPQRDRNIEFCITAFLNQNFPVTPQPKTNENSLKNDRNAGGSNRKRPDDSTPGTSTGGVSTPFGPKRVRNDNQPTQQQQYSTNRGSGGNQPKPSSGAGLKPPPTEGAHPSQRIRHPRSNQLDGSYYHSSNGILVIPAAQPNYSDNQVRQLKAWSFAEKKQHECKKCGGYFHTEDACTLPGRQCYRCYNCGHTGRDCPFFPNDKRK